MATWTGGPSRRTWPRSSPVTCRACGVGGAATTTPNLQLDRIGADYAAYVEDLGEPVGLAGWSAGAGHALAVASRSDAVRATAPYEPMASMLMAQEERAELIGALARGRELVEQGDLSGAMRAFAAFP